MKKLNRIKLNQLSKAELNERELKMLVGGCDGLCGCRLDNNANASANANNGYHVNGGYCYDITIDGGYLDEVIVYGYQSKP